MGVTRSHVPSVATLIALTACHRASVHADAATPPPARTMAPIEAPRPAPEPAPPPRAEDLAPWCFAPLPHAEARAFNRRGHSIAVRDESVRDETTGAVLVARLPSEIPCPTFRNHLAFDRDDNAALLLHGRLYVHRHDGPWSVTPVCTDVGGEPWTARSGGGFIALGRRMAGRELAMLMTDDRDGAFGWYATTALDRTITSALLEPDGSLMALEAGGHAILVDRVRTVAGEIIPAADALWTSLAETPSGIAITRDDSPDAREIVRGVNIQSAFERERRARPAGTHTIRVALLEFGRMLAVTDRGVEWSSGPARPFVEVVRWPNPIATDPPSAIDVTVGWLTNGEIAIAIPDGAVSRSCTELRDAVSPSAGSVHSEHTADVGAN
jgi:hypothetical protein